MMSAPLVRRSPTHSAVVVAASALTPRMRRVTVQADTMIGASLRPAQDVELLLREPGGRRVKRRYTIGQARPQLGELDLHVLIHGHGPGSAWGATAQPGDRVEFMGPRGKLTITPAGWHLLIGDESALPAIAAISAALPGDEPARAVIEVSDADDELPVAADVRWVHRGAGEPGRPEVLLAAVEALPLPHNGHAYLMGETRTMVGLRALLERRGFDHDAIFVKGYWNVGRPDRIAGRSPIASPIVGPPPPPRSRSGRLQDRFGLVLAGGRLGGQHGLDRGDHLGHLGPGRAGEADRLGQQRVERGRGQPQPRVEGQPRRTGRCGRCPSRASAARRRPRCSLIASCAASRPTPARTAAISTLVVARNGR